MKQAWKAFQAEEVPVGAVLVKDGHVIARGYNQVEMLHDATAHADAVHRRRGGGGRQLASGRGATCAAPSALQRVQGRWVLSECVLGLCGARQTSAMAPTAAGFDLFEKPHPTHTVTIVRGVLQEQATYLLKSFFQTS